MKSIKVLGTGCANCKTTLKLIEDIAHTLGMQIQLEKVEELSDIMGYGVMSTPGVVVDDVVVHAGGIPSKDDIHGWLHATTESKCCGGSSEQGNNDEGCC